MKKKAHIAKVRKRWVRSPAVRIKDSIKIYNRANTKKELKGIEERVEDEKGT